jgi:hypothetical protein
LTVFFLSLQFLIMVFIITRQVLDGAVAPLPSLAQLAASDPSLSSFARALALTGIDQQLGGEACPDASGGCKLLPVTVRRKKMKNGAYCPKGRKVYR